MVNSNNKFEINEFSDIFLIIYSIWVYSYNNNFSVKNSYLSNQFMLNYGIRIEDYLIENPILELEMQNELETKDLINSIYSLMNIQNSPQHFHVLILFVALIQIAKVIKMSLNVKLYLFVMMM